MPTGILMTSAESEDKLKCNSDKDYAYQNHGVLRIVVGGLHYQKTRTGHFVDSLNYQLRSALPPEHHLNNTNIVVDDNDDNDNVDVEVYSPRFEPCTFIFYNPFTQKHWDLPPFNKYSPSTPQPSPNRYGYGFGHD
ncbi:hypothetical protein ACH5RR_030355 [Cinchona calisaya]|uniref:Uncharacterized protein n=1 Tax=Cinchona calisaya TaxID=153742 RepID=A0ABD2YXD6_9GENT